MNLSQRTKNIVFISLLLPATIVGANIGSAMYSNQVLTDGILGITTLLFIYLLFNPLKDFVLPATGIRAEFPRDFKYIFTGFFISVVGYCSLRHVVELTLFIYDYFID